MDARVGGSYKMSFTNFSTGNSHSFGGTYHELVPGEKLRYTDKFDDPNLPGEMKVTVTLRKCCAERNSRSCRKAFRRRFRPRCATWVGRSRCFNWRRWSSRRFRGDVRSFVVG